MKSTQDITDKILLTPLNNYDEVTDIEYDKRLSDDDALDTSRIYKITFKNEVSMDRIIPKEIKSLNERTDIPVKAKMVSTGNTQRNALYIRLS